MPPTADNLQELEAAFEETHGQDTAFDQAQAQATSASGIDVSRVVNFVASIADSIRQGAQTVGRTISEAIFRLIEKSDYDLGYGVGFVTGMILFEVILSVLTGGGWLLVTAARPFIAAGRALLSQGRRALGKILALLRRLKAPLRRGLSTAGNVLGSIPGLGPIIERVRRARRSLFRYGDDAARTPTVLPRASLPVPPHRATPPSQTIPTRQPRTPRRGGGGSGNKTGRANERRKRQAWRQFRNQLRSRTRPYREHGIARDTLQAIVERLHLPVRLDVVVGRIGRRGKTYMVRAALRGHPPLRTVLRIRQLGTGSKDHPIPLIWFKPVQWHEMESPITLNPDPHRWTGATVAPDEKTIHLRDRKMVDVPPTQSTSFGGRRRVMLGVRKSFLPKVGEIVERTRASSRRQGMAGRFRTLLTNYQYDWLGKEADHVRDLGFGGKDVLRNLWPLSENKNRANRTYYEPISFEENSRETRGLPHRMIGKFFKIIAIKPPPGL